MFGLGAGSIKMLVDGKNDIWLYLGSSLIFLLAVIYCIILSKRIKIIKGDDNDS